MIPGHRVEVWGCPIHDDCHVIVGYQDGALVWSGHNPASVHPAECLNLDHPEAFDFRPKTLPVNELDYTYHEVARVIATSPADDLGHLGLDQRETRVLESVRDRDLEPHSGGRKIAWAPPCDDCIAALGWDQPLADGRKIHEHVLAEARARKLAR